MTVAAEPIVVLMTAPSGEEATRIAEMLVSQKLAACVQILPEMQSVYVWQDEVQREREVLIIAKSTGASFDKLERKVREMHSYETPEIVALPITLGSAPYLEWLLNSCEAS
jgi:periplasmic divalent cation tolerance protein